MATILVTAACKDEPMRFEQIPLETTFGVFREEVASRFGSSAFRLYLGSQYCKGGETLASKGVVDGSSIHLAPVVDKEARGKKRFQAGETKRSKYATLIEQGKELKEAVGAVGHTAQEILAGQAEAQADLTAIRAAIEPIQPTRIPGEPELMEQVLNTFKVAHMNSLLVRWRIALPRGIKKNGKARLLAQKAPLAELQEALRDSTASGNADGPLGLNAEDSADFQARLAAQVAQPARGPLDAFFPMEVAGAAVEAVAEAPTDGNKDKDQDQDQDVEVANLQEVLEMRQQFQAMDDVVAAQGAAAS